MRHRVWLRNLIATVPLFIALTHAPAQSIQTPWSGFAHTPQHDCVSSTRAQPLNRVLWTMELGVGTYAHFTPPVITRSNTVIFPSGTNGDNSYKIEALDSETGSINWELATDWNFGPMCPVALTPKNRLYFGGAGGTVFYCDTPDATTPPAFTRTAFYGTSNFLANSNRFKENVAITTPITPDRYGNIFFGFTSASSPLLTNSGGLARIDFNGTGTWAWATNVSKNPVVNRPAPNCAPALNADEKTLYMLFNNPNGYPQYLTALDSRTLAPLTAAPLIDPQTQELTSRGASTASPTIGPDGDVYIGTDRTSGSLDGWLLHFDRTLTVTKTPGAFGWDVTVSIVDARLVPSYHGNSSYLLATKYNNYATEQNKIAILDPNQGAVEAASGVTVMKEVLTILSPTAEAPGRYFEWCINSAAVDPFSKSLLANNEDGNLYRWDLTANALVEKIALASKSPGQAYTPSVIGPNGVVYAINHGTLFAVGQ